MEENLKTELDKISNKHQITIKSIFIKERIEQTSNAYEREYNSLLINLIEKSDKFEMANDKETENYIKELTKESKATFQNLLDS